MASKPWKEIFDSSLSKYEGLAECHIEWRDLDTLHGKAMTMGVTVHSA